MTSPCGGAEIFFALQNKLPCVPLSPRKQGEKHFYRILRAARPCLFPQRGSFYENTKFVKVRHTLLLFAVLYFFIIGKKHFEVGMKKINFTRSAFSWKGAALYFALIAAMIFMNFALPFREPLSFALFFAALAVGLNPYLVGAGYLLSAAPALNLYALFSAGAQTVFCVAIFLIYRRYKKQLGIERVLYALAAQIPFLFLFPHAGYGLIPLSPLLQKAILGAFIVLACFLFESGLYARLAVRAHHTLDLDRFFHVVFLLSGFA